ncbi:MAG: DUF2127 domain-containing protein [Rhodoferax sp.]|nr:DUF2127 domain-containing protein [Rhodoferax sp.]
MLFEAMPVPSNIVATRRALHTIALFEGVKGGAAIAASLGLLGLAHHDLRQLAFALIGHFHLSPDARYPKLLLTYAALLGNENLRTLVLFAWGYAAIRLTEAYGLWKDRAWAEWLAALSGAVYVPLEFEHLLKHPNPINAAVLIGNVGVVLYMALRLSRRRTERLAQQLQNSSLS